MQEEIDKYIKTWEQRCYKRGIPDEAPKDIEHLAPSYKLIAKAILSNNLSLLGIEQKPCVSYAEIKRTEIVQRKRKAGQPIQLTLF